MKDEGANCSATTGESRTWFNTIPAATAPAAVNIPDGPSGMGGSALTNEYFDASWYELQVLLNSGNHRHRDRLPVDWVYVIGRFLDLYRESRRPEPARLLVAVIKAMQSTDPRIGPEERGARVASQPECRSDDHGQRSVGADVPTAFRATRSAPLQSRFLAAWLDKNHAVSRRADTSGSACRRAATRRRRVTEALPAARYGTPHRQFTGGRGESRARQTASEMGSLVHRHGCALSVLPWRDCSRQRDCVEKERRKVTPFDHVGLDRSPSSRSGSRPAPCPPGDGIRPS